MVILFVPQVNRYLAEVTGEEAQVNYKVKQVKTAGEQVTAILTQVNSFHFFQQDFKSLMANLIEE
ncbi:hypothetical protein [Psychrobacillus psychrodurans]|uniref:Uncharacterized protein n=1 Tax=Psychrobacillus psychrodurans TaxID=126157 RepID=A0A9X3L959_9BACI|nr:hypothetical protein [Psychrobacillus psychrodurans]MCZ8533503.1 hypothetical protein [Psychrobacillus psychrodurans]